MKGRESQASIPGLRRGSGFGMGTEEVRTETARLESTHCLRAQIQHTPQAKNQPPEPQHSSWCATVKDWLYWAGRGQDEQRAAQQHVLTEGTQSCGLQTLFPKRKSGETSCKNTRAQPTARNNYWDVTGKYIFKLFPWGKKNKSKATPQFLILTTAWSQQAAVGLGTGLPAISPQH